jgi:hypothetical protein
VKSTPRTRAVAAGLVVIFVLTTVWAGYYLYSVTHPIDSGPGVTDLASFSQGASNNFTASMRPSYLYNNSTEIAGGNITLFTPITKWINITDIYSIQTNRTATISVAESFTVSLSTDVWSTPLAGTTNSSSSYATTGLSLVTTFDLNVSAIVAKATSISNQLNYTAASYTVTLDPQFSALVEVPGAVSTTVFDPVANFTFAGPLIEPAGFNYTGDGVLSVPNPPPAKATGLSAAAPYLALVGSVGGLGGSAWVASRRPEDEPLPPLDEMTRPFAEAIAATSRPPPNVVPTPVDSLTDLAKIADTLGRPILRPREPDPLQRTFYVVDGPLAYSYVYPAGGPSRPGGEGEGDPEALESVLVLGLISRLRSEVLRANAASLDASATASARARIRQTVELIKAGRYGEARDKLDELSLLLTWSPASSRRPPR